MVRRRVPARYEREPLELTLFDYQPDNQPLKRQLDLEPFHISPPFFDGYSIQLAIYTIKG